MNTDEIAQFVELLETYERRYWQLRTLVDNLRRYLHEVGDDLVAVEEVRQHLVDVLKDEVMRRDQSEDGEQEQDE